MCSSDLPCVLQTQRPGFLIGPEREFCGAWPDQRAVTVKAAHFLPEDSLEVARPAMASAVAKVLADQTRRRPAGRVDRR